MATAMDLGTANAILTKLDLLSVEIARIGERQRQTEELIEEFTPILKEVMATATDRLDHFEKKGYFAFGKEALGLVDRVVEGFSPDDVRQLGDAVVSILDTVRALTQPDVLAIAGEVSQVLVRADEAKPIGIVGMMRATRNDDVQRGMAVMMELLKHVGRAASAASKSKKPRAVVRQSARLALPAAPTKVDRSAPKRAAVCTPRNEPVVAATVIDGVAFTADGHVVDPNAWTRELGEKIAKTQGLPLGEVQWKIIEFARKEFLETKASPNIRRITQAVGLSTKEIYLLFPKAPARTVAKIAGIPKPAGCL
ncbi:MAG: TusE/DsrC/DsvC family sulfur relay protein [Deltaproteobacteria bacterium]|nr:TusE/DsrC/DsvC family sulfur relay protein [Deltaproteobacteria bacterium]